MYDVGTALRTALDGDHVPCARIVSLDASGAVRRVWEGTQRVILPGSSVTYDRTREVRRTASLQLANPDGSLSPQEPGDYFFEEERIRVERGAVLNGTPTYIPLFTGHVSSFDTSMAGLLSVSGEDPLASCQQPLGDVLTLAATLTLEDAIRTLLEPVLGDGSAWELDSDGATLGSVRTYAEDSDRLGAAMSLAADFACELYADRLGIPVLRLVPDPSLAPTVRTYVLAAGTSTLLDLRRSYGTRPYNRVIVIGEAPDRDVVRGQADVTDTASPIHVDRIGLRVAPIFRSAQIVDQGQANAVAQMLLIRYALYQDSIGTTVVPDPSIDEGDVVQEVELVSGTDDRYWLSQVTHPVVQGSQSLSGPKALPLFTP
jgi:hypothetical protein